MKPGDIANADGDIFQRESPDMRETIRFGSLWVTADQAAQARRFGWIRAERKDGLVRISRTAQQPVMNAPDVPTSIWQGTFTILGVTLRCHVLRDGQRIIEADSVAALLHALGSNDPKTAARNQDEIEAFARWRAGK